MFAGGLLIPAVQGSALIVTVLSAVRLLAGTGPMTNDWRRQKPTNLVAEARFEFTATTLVLGAGVCGKRVRLEDKLRRIGVRHPRRWMAAGTAALTFLGYLSDRAAAKRKQSMATPGDQPEQDSSPR